MKRNLILAGLAAAGMLAVTSAPAMAVVSRESDRSAEVFVSDVAAAQSVDPTIAARVIEISPRISDLAVNLDSMDGFAGLWLDWTRPVPTLKVAATATRIKEIESETARSGLILEMPVEFVRASVPLSQLRADQENIIGTLARSADGTVFGVAVRPELNRLEIEVPSSNKAAVEVAMQVAEVASRQVGAAPIAVVPIDSAGDTLAAVVFGGGLLTACTSAFTAKFGTARGLFTAGHCADAQTQVGISMPLVAGTDTCPAPPLSLQIADRQVNRIPAPHTASNVINISISPYTRTITSRLAAAGFYNGQPVTRQGSVSGYGGGTVETADYGNTTCGGLSHLVRATATVQRGDSGGPWFTGNQALGVTNAFSVNNWGVFSRITYVESGTGYVTCTVAGC
jgi:streptogrisin C